MDIVTLLIYALFVTRISIMFTEEEGIFSIFEKIRIYFGIFRVEDEDGITEFYGDTPSKTMQSILKCFWCFSMYPAFFIIAISLISVPVAFYIALPFALSMVAILVKEKFNV